MRNGNKSPKIPYSAMLMEVKKWSHHHRKLISSFDW